ncbi:MAG: hypothetical protein IT280_10500 [Ignavibacteria bacterium]|nr:hypothetical protein [Ignavibacteria bacterium]
MKRTVVYVFKVFALIVFFAIVYQLVNSSLDIYNNFAYDKAVLRSTPYGYIPLLDNPFNYNSVNSNVKGGDYVYVENWESADNGRIVFAKVRSKLNTGYINNRLLVEANINIIPIFSVLMLFGIFTYILRKLFFRLHII